MFAQICSALMSRYGTDALENPRPVGARLARAESDALEALRRQPGTMLLSERLKNPAAYRKIQAQRREMLLTLLMVNPTASVMSRIMDLICLICEETTWSANPQGVAFEDENHPSIDLQCAETAVLLGWTVRLLREKLDAGALIRMRNEARSRVFKPMLVYDDYDFMRGTAPCSMTIAADLLLAALFLESDESRALRIVKPALKLLDEACRRHGRALAPMEEVVTDVSAVTDLVGIIRDYSGGLADLSASIPTGDWLDEILFAWIHDDVFNNPAGENMYPELSGSDIFRIGAAADDDTLISLGSHLHHKNHLPASTVTGQLMELALSDRLESSFGKPQRLRYAALRDNLLMSARMPGLYCSLHVGGGRANAGDVCLFADTSAILIDGGKDCAYRSLPVIAGRTQLDKPPLPCFADFEDRDDREIMSVELTRAYPAECNLRSYQRTLLTLRDEHTVRIMDALDLTRPESVTFRFVTAVRPAIVSAAVRFGSVRMTWEGNFTAAAISLENGLTCVELTTAEPVQKEFFAFNFERA